MMEGTSDVSALKMLNHELVKVDHYDGINFSRWTDKMKFLLTALKLFYVLDPNLMAFPIASDEDTNEIKVQRKKREEDELICRGHILNCERLCPQPIFIEMLGQIHVNGWSRVVASQNGGSTSYIFPFRLRVLQWSRHLFNYWKNKKTMNEKFLILLI